MTKKPKIAVIVPPFTRVPPRGQGGTERIAHEMIEGFVKKGYKVTLFGAGPYSGSARYIRIFSRTIAERKIDTTYTEASRPLRLELAYIAKVMEELIDREKEFDIVFNHMRGGYLLLPLSLFLKLPIISVLHLPLFTEAANVFAAYKKPGLVTISNSQRKGFPEINYLATVYNGVNLKEFSFGEKPADYFVFMGALAEHKNPKDAILAALKNKSNLLLAGGKKREPYFSEQLKPLINNKTVRYIGEVGGRERINLLKKAKALIFPIKWQEPFGLVMIEAMACGTPVIAYPNGAAREVIEHGQTGFIVRNVKGLSRAMKEIDKIDRRKCRQRVENHFTNQIMVEKYEKIMKKLT